MMNSDLPLPYRIPQQGITVIEASAGTGKTYTLIRLIARHVLWYNRKIEQVLAVTFTEAATAELRIRLREFLQAIDAFCKAPSDDKDIEYLISEAPPEITETELYLRLTEAIGNIDKAAIFTIHGFCQRTLNEQPLLTGQSIPGPQFLESQAELIEQLCFEFWRNMGQHDIFSEVLQQTWSSPEQMQYMAYDLLSHAKLTPDRPDHATPPNFEAALEKFKTEFQRHGTEAQQLLLQAIESKAHNGVSHKTKKTIAQFEAIADFIDAPDKATVLDLSQIAASQFKPSKNGVSPVNPFFEAADQWLAFSERHQQYRHDLSLCLIHDFQLFLHARLAVLKNNRNVISFDDLIDGLHAALTETQDSELAARLREAYPVALVDEFQDTDDRQWTIFKAIYGQQESISLTLIGDPKQAIYAFRGGDIHTYLHARQQAQHVASLTGNYRSSTDMVDAVYGLFTHHQAQPFYEKGIDFVAVQAKLKLGGLVVNDVKIPALQVIAIAPNEQGKAQNKGTATLSCAQQCAQQIAWLSNEISLQRAEIRIDNRLARLLHFHDIAVLVATNKQASLMQRCLGDLGVASVCAGKSSVFDSYEALDIINILSYLHMPSGRRQQQNAVHGVLMQCLLGGNSLSAFDLIHYQGLWCKHGALSCFTSMLSTAEQAILGLPNGERRLSNYWQIIELVQDQSMYASGHAEIIDWLGLQIEDSKQYQQENSGQNPRLESGADRIRILTLHQSKGLEFGVVYLPFTAISQGESKRKNKLLRYFDGLQRCLYYQQGNLEPALASKIQLEQDSENLRLLYVGATRAKFALSVSYGAVKNIEDCALSRVLLGDKPPTTELIDQAMQSFCLSQSREILSASKPAERNAISPHYLGNTRVLRDSWHISSFSGLHQSKERRYSDPASDEYRLAKSVEHDPYKGTAFGNALHLVLEHAKKADWSVSAPNLLNSNARQLALTSLMQFGYDAASAEQGVALLCGLVFDTLHGLLPENTCLIQMPDCNMRHELEFHLSLNQANCKELLALLHQHNYCLNRQHFGFQQRLNGLLTGKIDLIYQHQDNFYIVDYKSNQLPDYQHRSLADSIKSQEYDLQYLLYCVALHRYLKQRIGTSYQYQQHFGGVRYLYSRGMRAGQASGIFSDRPAYSLIAQLDHCFDSLPRNAHVA